MRIKVQILAGLLITAFFSGCGGGSGGGTSPGVDVVDPSDFERVSNMSFGFQIIGDHGITQIDDKFFNLSLKQKGQIYMAQQTADMQFATLTVNAQNPVLCIRPTLTSIALIKVQRAGDQYTYTFGGFDPNPETFWWYLFDQVPVVQQWGHAMAWNEQGQPTFNSDYPVMKVRGIAPLPSADLTAQNGSVDAGVAGQYAVCITQGRIQHISRAIAAGQFQGAMYVEGVRVTNTGAVSSPVLRSRDNAGIRFSSFGGGQLMLVDVAGL